MHDLDDSAFLDLLEQNLGRRWPKHWRARVWNMAPTQRDERIRGTCDAHIQQQAILRIRHCFIKRAIDRLTKKEPEREHDIPH